MEDLFRLTCVVITAAIAFTSRQRFEGLTGRLFAAICLAVSPASAAIVWRAHA